MWVFDWDSSTESYSFSQVPQELLPGDTSKVMKQQPSSGSLSLVLRESIVTVWRTEFSIAVVLFLLTFPVALILLTYHHYHRRGTFRGVVCGSHGGDVHVCHGRDRLRVLPVLFRC